MSDKPLIPPDHANIRASGAFSMLLHDLASPVSTIVASSELLADMVNTPDSTLTREDMRELVLAVAKTSTQLAQMLDWYREYAKALHERGN